MRVCTQYTKRNRTTNSTGEGTPEEVQEQTASAMEMYEKQSMAVRCNNAYSDSFGVSNGVKQGGVLSHRLPI